MKLPVAATSLDLRYELREDRLVLTARTAASGLELLLTRRLTRALLAGLLELLMQTSDLVARSGAAHRSDVLLFEHLEAVTPFAAGAAPPQGAPPSLTAEIQARPPRLVDRIDLTIKPGALLLSLRDEAGELAWMNLSRPMVHQLINMLLIKCREAGWNLDELAWIDRAGQIVVPEGSRLC